MNSALRFPARHARALLAVGLLCAGLLGCGSLPSAPPPVEVYDFGPLPSRNLPARPWRLAVDVRMPAWYEALPIDYRLDYDDPLLQRAYTGSRWAAAPASLIARQLRRQLGEFDGKARSVDKKRFAGHRKELGSILRRIAIQPGWLSAKALGHGHLILKALESRRPGLVPQLLSGTGGSCSHKTRR